MSTGRVWPWAQLIVTEGSLVTAGIQHAPTRRRARVAADEVEIARVHEEPGGLADHEHRIPPMDGVGQERHAAAQEKYQKYRGTTLLRWRSDATHWTRKRAEKNAWPRKPMPSQR